MQKKFESNILKNQLFSKQDKLLLAISGGVDSVVLAHLLKRGGFNFSLAHCNFKLRGKDSDADEAFCKALAKSLKVKLHVHTFDVDEYCKKNKVSIQMAARQLRYSWFNDLLKKHKLKCLITAHHANDVVETVFINLGRGTGIKGLKGIAEKTETIARPLLVFTKEEIEQFARKEKIAYRLDKSNLEAKYQRNLLRLEIIPKLKKLYPNLEQTFLNNAANFKEESDIINDFLEARSLELVSKKRNLVLIDKSKLKNERYIKTILHYLLEPYGFTLSQVNDIKTNLHKRGESGKLFYTPAFALTIDRDVIIIRPGGNTDIEPVQINSLHELKRSELVKTEEIKGLMPVKINELIIEKDKLIYPLTIRTKKTGDRFRPFGMKGFKKLSDFLKDQKLNAFEKETCRLLENGNGDIIWVIGHRSDDRYKITSPDQKLLKLTVVE